MLNEIQTNLLKEISGLHKIPQGAVSLRLNGKTEVMESTKDIIITPRTDKNGFFVRVKPNTKNKSLHIPVIIDNNTNEEVFNDFEIGENCDILIVAGCGIHGTNTKQSSHNGVHSFIVGKNSKVRYVEKHLGLGNSKKTMNPKTEITLQENAVFEMETVQLGGVSVANRTTNANIAQNSVLIAKEKILTDDKESANTFFTINLDGQNSRAEIISRSVAKQNSKQTFKSNLIGKNACFGRVECDGILMDNAVITSSPSVVAMHSDASLSHEAQVGKIDGDALIKLMTMGLNRQEAEEQIIAGYLKSE